MNSSGIYRIETERLVIRCYEPGDAARLHQAITRNLDHLAPWMPWISQETGGVEDKLDRIRKFREAFDQGKDHVYGIFNKAGDRLIGSTGLHPRIGEGGREIGYWISVEYLRQGFALEAVSALAKTGFSLEGLSRIEIHCDVRNIASQAIPRRLGFRLEAILKEGLSDANGLRETMIWTLLRADYDKNPVRGMPIRAYDITGKELKIPDEPAG
jgi:RimJ/RimL family protein N-acetyltransferase